MKKTFEENMKELENVALELEKSNLTLDEAIANFEKGIKLSKICTKTLDEAEKKINILIETSNDTVDEESFEYDKSE